MMNLFSYARVALPIVLLIFLLVYQFKNKKAASTISRSSYLMLFVFTATLLLLLAFSEYNSMSNASALGHAMFSPGSLITRSVIFTSSLPTRRLLEPSILFFVLFISVHASRFLKLSAQKLFKLSISLIPVILFIEGHYLQEQLSMPFHAIPPTYLIGTLWVFSFIGITTSFALELFITSSPLFFNNSKSRNPVSVLIPAGIIWLLAFTLNGIGIFHQVRNDTKNYLAAHYYLWFPENWPAGYAGKSDPGKFPTPSLGEYRSTDSNIIQKHLDDMTSAGINLILLDWWPRRPELKDRAVQISKELQKHPKMRFAAHVETLDIDKKGSRGVITLGDNEVLTLSLFIQHLGKRLFAHPQYLKTQDGRPIVYLYASRHLVGDLGAALKQVKLHSKKTVGYEPFFIGDEVFPNVPEMKNSGATALLPPLTPSWNRIVAFDAITLYNPYNPDQKYPAGDEGITLFLEDTKILYGNYRAILEAAGKVFIPTLIPGYDDRVLRPTLNSQPIPRYNSLRTSTLTEMANLIKDTMGSSMPNMASITSWNEWNEGTQIEPGLSTESAQNLVDLNTLNDASKARDILWSRSK